MNRRLIRMFGVLLFLLFIGGTIILPTYHRAHCSDNDATHQASTCPICQFANTPVMSASQGIAPVGKAVATEKVLLQIVIPVSASLRDASQARAPPSC